MRDRRRAPRQEILIPVRIDSPEKKGRVGMVCNASRTGMLVGTQSRFQLGQWVELTFKPTLEAAWMRARGRIVRIEIDEARELFRRLIAIDFERPIVSA